MAVGRNRSCGCVLLSALRYSVSFIKTSSGSSTTASSITPSKPSGTSSVCGLQELPMVALGSGASNPLALPSGSFSVCRALLVPTGPVLVVVVLPVPRRESKPVAAGVGGEKYPTPKPAFRSTPTLELTPFVSEDRRISGCGGWMRRCMGQEVTLQIRLWLKWIGEKGIRLTDSNDRSGNRRFGVRTA